MCEANGGEIGLLHRVAPTDRRRLTQRNVAIRRMIEVLGWAAAVPPARQDDARGVMRGARSDAIAALRSESHSRPFRPPGYSSAVRGGVLLATAFLLGLGLGLSHGGASK